MSELRKSLTERTRKAITDSDMTFKDIADVVGVSRAAISGYMKGGSSLSMEKEITLLEYFGYKFEMEQPDATTV